MHRRVVIIACLLIGGSSALVFLRHHGSSPDAGSTASSGVVERARFGSASIVLARDESAGRSTLTVRRPGLADASWECDCVVPPHPGLGGEMAAEHVREIIAADPGNPAPILSRGMLRGPGGQTFLAWGVVEHAAVMSTTSLVIFPIVDGELGEPCEHHDAMVHGVGDGMRIMQADFAESGLIVPGHGTLASITLRWDGSGWSTDIHGMRLPPMPEDRLTSVINRLRREWNGCENEDCTGNHGDLSIQLTELIYSGNAAQAWRLVEGVLEGRSVRDRAFLELFMHELHQHARLGVVRAINGGSLGPFEQLAADLPSTPTTRNSRSPGEIAIVTVHSR
jgi:hypothetical protein